LAERANAVGVVGAEPVARADRSGKVELLDLSGAHSAVHEVDRAIVEIEHHRQQRRLLAGAL
jgi:hypothetical protein